jgi:uncharacterized protein (TIGR00730 family)
MAAICVFCGASDSVDQQFLDLATRVGEILAQRGHTVVSGGSRAGMMGTLAAGARAGRGNTVGVVSATLAFREAVDTLSDELVRTDDLFSRKRVLMEKADGFLILPGGLGTLDEMFEVWTSAGLAVHDKPVVLLDFAGVYTGLLRWLAELVERGFVRQRVLDGLVVVDSVTAAVEALECRTGVV